VASTTPYWVMVTASHWGNGNGGNDRVAVRGHDGALAVQLKLAGAGVLDGSSGRCT